MRTLLITVLLAMSLGGVDMIGAKEVSGPRVTGNGGGGVKKNGIYKTFHSAGIYVIPEELSDIPGGSLYKKTIAKLLGEGESTAKLLRAALPLANRKFYNIDDDRMDEKTMARLMEEYGRIVNQPAENLAIFAITEINSATTYLLPAFYKLSEVEQAAILFHEAYWILNPKANYSEVIDAEISFQKFIELKEQGKYGAKLPRILGELLDDETLALKSAYEHDRVTQATPGLISKEGKIKIKSIFIPETNSCKMESKALYKKGIFGTSVKDNVHVLLCEIGPSDLQKLMLLEDRFPESAYAKELIHSVSKGLTVVTDKVFQKEVGPEKFYEIELDLRAGVYGLNMQGEYYSFSNAFKIN